MHEPAFWWRQPGVAATLLAPVAAAYGAIAARRMAGPGRKAALPVICAGNFTLGGSGKTPAAIAIATLLKGAGARPALLTRGYGGTIAGPVAVDAERHSAADVGDEALLLARVATTIVARDRVAGADAAKAAGANVVVMDDGLQNAALEKDLVIAVVDSRRGVGNGRVFPAGPLRAPLGRQFARTDAMLIVGSGASTITANLASAAAQHDIPLFHARLEPDRAAIDAFGGRKALAFAGIGDPEKFFAGLTEAGIEAPICRAFPDHHRYTAEEAGALIMQAEHEGLRLLTTEKDHARMHGDPALAALASRSYVLPVKLVVEEDALWRALLLKAARRG